MRGHGADGHPTQRNPTNELISRARCKGARPWASKSATGIPELWIGHGRAHMAGCTCLAMARGGPKQAMMQGCQWSCFGGGRSPRTAPRAR
eukprot:9272323-Pyramimonas_sp.AAC.1